MPIYLWVDKKSGKQVEIIRSFAEYENPPEGDEVPAELQGTEPQWERSIGDKISLVKGNGWGAGKGYWIQLLTTGAAVCILMQSYLV